jgi:hypothetical protein
MASRSGLGHKLQVIITLLKEEGEKQSSEINPSTIAELAWQLQKLTEEFPMQAGFDSDVETKIKHLEDQIASVRQDLRIERGARSTTFQRLESELDTVSRQWRWVCWVGLGIAMFFAFAVGFVLLLQPWRAWL